jgi:hypothetical protein
LGRFLISVGGFFGLFSIFFWRFLLRKKSTRQKKNGNLFGEMCLFYSVMFALLTIISQNKKRHLASRLFFISLTLLSLRGFTASPCFAVSQHFALVARGIRRRLISFSLSLRCRLLLLFASRLSRPLHSKKAMPKNPPTEIKNRPKCAALSRGAPKPQSSRNV